MPFLLANSFIFVNTEKCMLNNVRRHVLSSLQFGAFPNEFKNESDAYKRSKVIIMGVPLMERQLTRRELKWDPMLY